MSFRTRFLSGPAFFVMAAFAAAASAQTWTPEQQEIWKLEELQWKMSMDKDLTWIDKMVHPNINYWDVDRPAPQNKAGLTKWNRFTAASGTTLEQELYPISITITGNVAVVQYTYSVVRENYKKERQSASGRYTDILIKEGGRWMFIAWAGGDDPKK
jgi:ketosteroid isomerase-like protein